MNLSPHFTLEELTASDTAARLGIDNTPSAAEIEKLTWLAGKLEELRAVVGPLHVNSAYRCLALNRAIGSKDNSQHVLCEAADLKSLIGGVSPLQLCEQVARSDLRFDQVIFEFSSWMHISFAHDRPPRGHLLTINKGGTFAGLVEPKAVA